jgi:F420-non-reducing hydrogenase small subunit
MVIKVAFIQGSSCWGCHQSLLNLHLGLLPALPELDIVYWPAVLDFKLSSLEGREDGSIDVGFYEGMLRTEHDVHLAKVLRAKSKILIAFGACACYGSVKGLANQWSKGELLERKFQQCESVLEPNDMLNNKDPELTGITDKIINLDKVVNVDAYMPGCPPKKENILGDVIFLIKAQPAVGDKNSNVCTTCKAEPCLLEKGKLCFGEVTAGGCNLMCPNGGDSCVGCYGASSNPDGGKVGTAKSLLNSLSATKDQANLIAKFLILYNGLPPLGSLYLKADPMRKLANNEDVPLGDDVPSAAIKALKKSGKYEFIDANVCSQCDRAHNMTNEMNKVKRVYEGLPDTEECLLNQGYMCMGPVTSSGCGAVCPSSNSVCSGCYGPAGGITSKGAVRMSPMVNMGPVNIDQIKDKIPDPVGLFYRFSNAAEE